MDIMKTKEQQTHTISMKQSLFFMEHNNNNLDISSNPSSTSLLSKSPDRFLKITKTQTLHFNCKLDE